MAFVGLAWRRVIVAGQKSGFTIFAHGARVVAGAMRAAGFVDVKVDVTRLQGAARWTPVVGVKAR